MSEVLVVGAAGAHAQAVLGAAARGGSVALTPLDQACDLTERAASADLVVNFEDPAQSGTAVLDTCIESGCDYLDVCTDAAVTGEMLARDEAAKAAGVRALIGMGAAPGLSNVLVRAGAEWLGGADEVSISWVADATELDRSDLQQLRRVFGPAGPGGQPGEAPAWEDLSLRSAEFPAPFGERLVIGLAHPEQVTMPRFLGIETVRSYGSVVPEDSMVVNWALARLGASKEEGDELYGRYLRTRTATAGLGSALVVDVWSGEEGVRFSSADSMGLSEAFGVPAAAGVALMLEGGLREPGVVAPECLDPAEFFRCLGRLSRGTGSLGAYRLWGSEEGVRIHVRDLLSTRTH
ncbi:MAG TPA: saccharopine dehydrogenase NADP-binding domain-containing protein [Actinomycetota bacterium]|nr:saccharopine dehydrogenase NADP-binding domain-containing protein [Actinomycetota bacterium]